MSVDAQANGTSSSRSAVLRVPTVPTVPISSSLAPAPAGLEVQGRRRMHRMRCLKERGVDVKRRCRVRLESAGGFGRPRVPERRGLRRVRCTAAAVLRAAQKPASHAVSCQGRTYL